MRISVRQIADFHRMVKNLYMHNFWISWNLKLRKFLMISWKLDFIRSRIFDLDSKWYLIDFFYWYQNINEIYNFFIVQIFLVHSVLEKCEEISVARQKSCWHTTSHSVNEPRGKCEMKIFAFFLFWKNVMSWIWYVIRFPI